MQTIENEGDATSRVALTKTVQYADIDKAWKNQIWEKYRYVFDNGKYNDARCVLLQNTETAIFL